jgi:hypothetical protein
MLIDEAVRRLARIFSQEHSRREPEWRVLNVDEWLLAENEPFYSRLSDWRPAYRLICSRLCDLQLSSRSSPCSHSDELLLPSRSSTCSQSGELR